MYHSPVILQPNEQNLALIRARHRRYRRAASALMWPLVSIETQGRQHLPADGPLVVVANHTNVLDPITVCIAAVRPLIWVGTRTLLTGPLGRVVAGFGMIPKQRFAADVTTVRMMKKWLDLGAAVAVFPEGERSWSGRQLPLVPGVERLVRMMQCPVIRARCHNTYLQWPRWAPRPRRGRVAVQFSEPRTFERRADPDAMRDWLARGTRVDVRSRPDLRLKGRSLATGLTNVVFVCPQCQEEGHMVEHGEQIECRRCSSRFTVDLGAQLMRQGDDPLDLGDWMTQTQRICIDRLPADGPLLKTPEPVEWMQHGEPGTKPTAIARGILVLYRDRLAVEADGRTLFTLDLTDIANMNIEYRHSLELRTADRFFTALITSGSAWRWPWTVRAVQAG